MSLSSSSMPDGLAFAIDEADETVVVRDDTSMTPGASPAPASAPPPDERAAVDARLVQRIAAGDKQAFAELYDRFSGPLYGTAMRVLHDAAEAQDVVHDAFVTVWEKSASFEPERGSAFSWVVTLVRNRAIDRVRMRRRRADLLAESAPADLGYDTDNPQTSGGETAALGDEAARVRAAVATLPLEQKRALELAFFGGLTQDEIARTLREPLGTIKARIRRGLLKLRQSLAHRS